MGSRYATICRQFTSAAVETAGDAELLSRFSTAQDGAAFAVLVKRHGPMVWSVCRNLLANAADADDAFQATFLALVRGSKSVRKPEALGAWLHGVAVRVAGKLKRSAARRTSREKKVANGEAAIPVADSRWDEVLAAVHEEVARLPDGERTAFIVCCLEGVRQPEAAEQLGWKPGTLTGRLSKAKGRLLERLGRRGLAPAMALGALGLGTTTVPAMVPGKLFESVTNFAANAGSIPPSLLQLSQGVLDMTITKVKVLAATILVAGGLAVGGGAGWFANADAQSAPLPTPKAATAKASAPGAPGASGAAAPPAQVVTSGMAMRGPTPRPWDYKLVDITTMDRAGLKNVLDKEGADGWELAAIDSIVFGGRDTERTAVLKRQKSSLAPLATTGGPGMGMPSAGNPVMPPGSSANSFPAPAAVAGGLTPSSSLPSTAGGRYGSGGAAPFPAPAPTATLGLLSRAAGADFMLHTIPLRSTTAANVAKIVKELIAIDEFQGGVTAVIADEDANSLLVKATNTGKSKVVELVQKLEDSSEVKKKNESKLSEKKARP